ncbi:hypothetical protein FACS1894201_00860 [Bacteroidia bacterium]|nr:hypothetical protein FACS1894201_00860 [Bacteroidia bacterium]
MKTTAKITIFILFLTSFVACDIDHLWDKDYLFTVIEPQDGVFRYDCSSYTDWHFFSFAAGEIIGSCDAGDAEAYEAWHNRTDWDLAFHRQNIKTNSGVSGVGSGGIQKYQQETFNFDAIIEAPEDGYQTDVPDSVIYDMSGMMTGSISYAYTGLSQPVKAWTVLTDMQNGIWTYVQSAFIVRTATGKYAKIYLRNFKSDVGASGTITMQYVYQNDGTINLAMTK